MIRPLKFRSGSSVNCSADPGTGAQSLVTCIHDGIAVVLGDDVPAHFRDGRRVELPASYLG